MDLRQASIVLAAVTATASAGPNSIANPDSFAPDPIPLHRVAIESQAKTTQSEPLLLRGTSCGNSTPDPGEACDDGNTTNGDGCSATCLVESGYECTGAIAGFEVDALANPGFGNPPGGAPWVDSGTPLPPICRFDLCPFSGQLDSDGDGWMYMTGGLTLSSSVTSAVQMAVIPPGPALMQLDVNERFCEPAGGFGDFVTVEIDGNEVFNSQPCDETLGFETYSIDLATAPGGPYNDGGQHLVDIKGSMDAVGFFSGVIIVDSVRITGQAPPIQSDCTLKPIVTKSADKNSAAPGDVITYEITVINSGAADTITVTDNIPENSVFVADSETEAVVGGAVSAPWAFDGTAVQGSLMLGPGAQLIPSPSPIGFQLPNPLSDVALPAPADQDDGSVVASVPGFNFRGATYTDAIMSVNGTLEIGTASGTASGPVNLPLPDINVPNNLLAPFWTNLAYNNPINRMYAFERLGYRVFYWANMGLFGDPDAMFSFQIQISAETGQTWFVYNEIPSIPPSLTVGFENDTGTSGTSYYFDGNGVAPGVGTDLKMITESRATLGFKVTAAGSDGDRVINVAKATNSTVADSAGAVTVIDSAPDDSLVVTKVADTQIASPGDTIAYEISAINRGPSSTLNVADSVPSNSVLVDGSLTETISGGTATVPWTSNGNALSGSFMLGPGNLLVPSPSPLGYVSLETLVMPHPKPNDADEGRVILNVPAFTYKGTTYDKVTWWVNGVIEIGTGSQFLGPEGFTDLPDPSQPNNVIAPFWTDLDLTDSGIPGADESFWYVVTGLEDGADSYTVFEWDNVPLFDDDLTRFTFQVWIGEGTDNIWFVYEQIPSIPPLLTVGFEDSAGTAGFSYYFNGSGTTPAVGTDLKFVNETAVSLGFLVTAVGSDGDLVVNVADVTNSIGIESAGSVTVIENDTDEDSILDNDDNCTLVVNPDQRDDDGDGYGNLCDADLDGSCFVNFFDLNAFGSVFGTSMVSSGADFDGNGFVNFFDLSIFGSLFGTVPGPSGLTSACSTR